MTSEADRKRQLVAEINSLPGAKARRVEDRWATGVLDMIIKLPGYRMIWAEGKLIAGNLFAPTPAQFREGVEWIKVGVPAILIGWKQQTMFISPWAEKVNVDECLYYGSGKKLVVLLDYMESTYGKRE